MYMVSREYLNMKEDLFTKLIKKPRKEELLVSNILFAEQWPYCLSMIIVYLEFLLFTAFEIIELFNINIIYILINLEDNLFLTDKM